MFKLEGGANTKSGNKISFGSRAIIYPKDKEECINALKHYLIVKHNKRKCPSCREYI